MKGLKHLLLHLDTPPCAAGWCYGAFLSADTEVEEVAASKGLKAVTSAGLKNKKIVAIFTNRTKRTTVLT